jgi:hypothetical protein
MSHCKHRGLAEVLACPLCHVDNYQQTDQLQALGWQAAANQLQGKRLHRGDCGLDANHEGQCGPAPPADPVSDNERDVRRHIRIMALAMVDREAALIESARWLFEVAGRSDLADLLGGKK